MRQENNPNEQAAAQADLPGTESAFNYLKSLPRNHNRSALDSYKRGRESAIIDDEVAAEFTTNFRSATETFTIPVSWNLTKSALVNLLGITSYDGFGEVNGIRFYAGINTDNQLTLIAVSTQAGDGCSDDLTLAEKYPYYDYANPCPHDCSNRGNLKVNGGLAAPMTVAAVKL
ncbi:hypothetical protein [Taibaiella helva]|uniref:hypothetical protein n=1 Tax=Taibaiella helva TaxID=2301235 RepID=UPI000E5816FB|nr:hypothetical protein [Taibaiella helva]